MVRSVRILFYGVVQGVGFRPAVYRAAVKRGLEGYVMNCGSHVEVVLKGGKREVEEFLSALNHEIGPLVRIERIEVKEGNFEGEGFIIMPSEGKEEDTAYPPDIAVCEKCLEEMFDRENRRYLYPFTNCTNCGARFTVIEALPYDRERTAMRDFRLCRACREEYTDPLNRRFHAQTISCWNDGPEVYLMDGEGRRIETSDPIREFSRRMEAGEVGIMKGWGGMHLTALPEVSGRIRELYSRPFKPLAVMVRDIEEAERWGEINEHARRMLLSPQRPIVLVKKKEGERVHLAEKVAPGLPTVGLYLPYTGIQHILFFHMKKPYLIMSSANLPGEPMAIEESEALRLPADVYLFHRRKIVMRADDSLLIPREEGPLFIRKSRGYVPEPVTIPWKGCGIAVGPEMNSTGALAQSGKMYLTQYIGNLRSYSNLRYMQEALEHLRRMTGSPEPEFVAIDMHPAYSSRRLGEELSERFGAEVVEVQHHHAHASALALEWNLSEITALTLDGVGYGEDGTLWGGEVIRVEGGEYLRRGTLSGMPLPGGDAAVKRPVRIVWAMAERLGYDEIIPDTREAELTRRLAPRAPLSSSMGRFMDAVAASLGICSTRTYDGEPAMRLESYLDAEIMLSAPVPPIEEKGGLKLVDLEWVFHELFESLTSSRSTCEVIAERRKVHLASNAVGSVLLGLLLIALEDERGDVGLTGGVAYNREVEAVAEKFVREQGSRLLLPRVFPAGDGGISAGQVSVAFRRLAGD